jgi:hypothetical protein
VTSIVCWLNDDAYFKGLWAVADSRVTDGHGVLSDNVPKLFPIPLQYYMDGDIFHERPVRFLSPMLGFSGSTFIGLNVKEVLSNYLGNLSPISYYGEPLPTFEERIPTLFEIAKLAKRVGEIYLQSVGQLSPRSAKCEFVLFGFCRRSEKFKAFKLFNSPANPASITVVEQSLNDDNCIVLGDRKDEVQARIGEKRVQFSRASLNWGRSPIIVMADILKSEGISSIGGHMQLWAALRFENRLMTISHMNSPLPQHVGFRLFEDLGQVGGFMTGHAIGLSMPGTEGWSDPAA